MTAKRPLHILLFRRDLRLADNPALVAAAAKGTADVLPLAIDEDCADAPRAIGAAGAWWRRESLKALEESLRHHGLPLLRRCGDPRVILPSLLRECGARAVYWNARNEPAAAALDRAVAARLLADGIPCHSLPGSNLFAPEAVRTAEGRPYRVFSAFWRACLRNDVVAPPLPIPARLIGPSNLTIPLIDPSSEAVRDAAAAAQMHELTAFWRPGEQVARNQLEDFLRRGLAGCCDGRDLPGDLGTSRLSPHLTWGEISARQIWHAVRCQNGGAGAETYLKELGWREFARDLHHHFPSLAAVELRPNFARFPWRRDSMAETLWQTARTGFPLIDAGMRELRATGWMHNRVRMVVASFLSKELMIDWRRGERFYWDMLVDADPATNPCSWQWVAGCGVDAAPFHRIFSAERQGRRFDPKGLYVRRWLPELSDLPDAFVHAPWQAPESVLAKAGVRLDESYPRTILDQRVSRPRALQAYHDLGSARVALPFGSEGPGDSAAA